MRAMIKFAALAVVAVLISACTADHVDLRTVRCALNSYAEMPQESFGTNAVNARAGLVIAHGSGVIDVWRGCGSSDRTVLTTAARGLAVEISVSPNGRHLLTSEHFPVEEFDLETGKSVAVVPGCTAAWAIFAPDGRFALLSCLGGIGTLDLSAGTIVASNRFERRAGVTSMAANDAFDLVALGTSLGEIHIVSVERTNGAPQFQELRSIDTRLGTWIQGLAFERRSGNLVSVARAGQVHVWDVRSGELKQSWQANVPNVLSVTFYCGDRFAAIFGIETRNGSWYPINGLIDTVTGRQSSFATGVFGRSASYIPELGGFIVNSGPRPPRLVPDLMAFQDHLP